MPFPFTHANGTYPCCSNPNGMCPACTAKLAAENLSLHSAEDFTPQDPYAASIATLRAANATPESQFAEQYKAERLRDHEAEYAAAALRTAQQPAPRITNLAEFEPPDPYREGIRRLLEGR